MKKDYIESLALEEQVVGLDDKTEVVPSEVITKINSEYQNTYLNLAYLIKESDWPYVDTLIDKFLESYANNEVIEKIATKDFASLNIDDFLIFTQNFINEYSGPHEDSAYHDVLRSIQGILKENPTAENPTVCRVFNPLFIELFKYFCKKFEREDLLERYAVIDISADLSIDIPKQTIIMDKQHTSYAEGHVMLYLLRQSVNGELLNTPFDPYHSGRKFLQNEEFLNLDFSKRRSYVNLVRIINNSVRTFGDIDFILKILNKIIGDLGNITEADELSIPQIISVLGIINKRKLSSAMDLLNRELKTKQLNIVGTERALNYEQKKLTKFNDYLTNFPTDPEQVSVLVWFDAEWEMWASEEFIQTYSPMGSGEKPQDSFQLTIERILNKDPVIPYPFKPKFDYVQTENGLRLVEEDKQALRLYLKKCEEKIRLNMQEFIDNKEEFPSLKKYDQTVLEGAVEKKQNEVQSINSDISEISTRIEKVNSASKLIPSVMQQMLDVSVTNLHNAIDSNNNINSINAAQLFLEGSEEYLVTLESISKTENQDKFIISSLDSCIESLELLLEHSDVLIDPVDKYSVDSTSTSGNLYGIFRNFNGGKKIMFTIWKDMDPEIKTRVLRLRAAYVALMLKILLPESIIFTGSDGIEFSAALEMEFMRIGKDDTREFMAILYSYLAESNENKEYLDLVKREARKLF